LRVPLSEVEEVPSIFNTQGQVKHLSGMCRLDLGERLVSILNVDSVMQTASGCVQDHLTEHADMMNSPSNSDSDLDEDDQEGQVVVFKLGAEEFGVNIHSVQEIVRVPDQLTQVPQSPDFLEGVINLRGSVLPVVDQRRRMGMPAADRCDRQRIMVYLMEGVRTGFIVDSVTEVLRLDPRCIADTPVEGLHSAALIPKVANLPDSKRMILLIDHQALLSSAELRDMRNDVELPSGLGHSQSERMGAMHTAATEVLAVQEVMA